MKHLKPLLVSIEICADAEKQLLCTALSFFILTVTQRSVQALYWLSVGEIFTDRL